MRTQLKRAADPRSGIRLVGESRPAPVRKLVTVPYPPAPARHVMSADLRDIGEDNPFHLQVWTTAYGNGAMTRDCVWVRGMYALVVAVVEDRVVCIRQYKKAAGQVLLVLPWGGLEGDESPLEAGRRELEEETGYSFHGADIHGPFFDLPDKSTGGHWVIVARDAYRKGDPAPDEGELILGTELIPVGQLWRHRFPVLMHVGALRLAGL